MRDECVGICACPKPYDSFSSGSSADVENIYMTPNDMEVNHGPGILKCRKGL